MKKYLSILFALLVAIPAHASEETITEQKAKTLIAKLSPEERMSSARKLVEIITSLSCLRENLVQYSEGDTFGCILKNGGNVPVYQIRLIEPKDSKPHPLKKIEFRTLVFNDKGAELTEWKEIIFRVEACSFLYQEVKDKFGKDCINYKFGIYEN
jgi:hypothetical protein